MPRFIIIFFRIFHWRCLRLHDAASGLRQARGVQCASAATFAWLGRHCSLAPRAGQASLPSLRDSVVAAEPGSAGPACRLLTCPSSAYAARASKAGYQTKTRLSLAHIQFTLTHFQKKKKITLTTKQLGLYLYVMAQLGPYLVPARPALERATKQTHIGFYFLKCRLFQFRHS